MAQPTTIKEAAERQLALWKEAERTDHYPRDIRWASLRAGYVFGPAPDHGMGWFVTNVATDEVCEFKGRWMLNDAVLLCQECFEDGT